MKTETPVHCSLTATHVLTGLCSLRARTLVRIDRRVHYSDRLVSLPNEHKDYGSTKTRDLRCCRHRYSTERPWLEQHASTTVSS